MLVNSGPALVLVNTLVCLGSGPGLMEGCGLFFPSEQVLFVLVLKLGIGAFLESV